MGTKVFIALRPRLSNGEFLCISGGEKVSFVKCVYKTFGRMSLGYAENSGATTLFTTTFSIMTFSMSRLRIIINNATRHM